jgi:hypothetical protein
MEDSMPNLSFNLPTFGFIVATRAALGVGIGMLLADRIPANRRRKIALLLVSIGAATTIPAVMAVQRGAARSLDPTR